MEIEVFLRRKAIDSFKGVADGFESKGLANPMPIVDDDVICKRRVYVHGKGAVVEIWVDDKLVKSFDLDEEEG